MIVHMKKLFLYGLAPESSRLLAGLLRLGCIQVQSPETFADMEQIQQSIVHRPAELYTEEQRLARLATAIATLAPYEGKKSLFAKRPRVSFKSMEDASLLTRAEDICQSIEDTLRAIAELKSQIAHEEFIKASLTPWLELDLPLEFSGTARTGVEYLVLPPSVSLENLNEELAQSGKVPMLQQISADKDQRYALLITHKDEHTDVWDILRQSGVSRAGLEPLTGTPAQVTARCDKRIDDLGREILAANDTLAQYAQELDGLRLAYDLQNMRLDCGKASQKLLHTEKAFLLTGWIPAESQQKVEAFLSGRTCYYAFADPTPQDEPPVLLKNSKLVEPFEIITQMYSTPHAKGMDPGPFLVIFYFIFFGMMLSDAGYGLLLFFAGLVATRFMDLTPFAKKFAKFITLCGISTVIWGALYGSWFGNLVPQLTLSFFGNQVNMPVLLDPLKDPITILLISFALGALHLFLGMGLKAYLMIRRGHVWDAIFDVGFWYLVLVGLPLLLVPGPVATIGQYMAIGGAVGLIFTQGRGEKNILKRLSTGLLSLYDITGYFSDLLSYSRILALGLATGVIANVVNIMGTLPGPNIIGIVAFIAIFAFGHALNLAISALGAYVHASRLQYVEFFGKFYEGGGKAFAPLCANPKYVVVTNKEEDK